MNIPVLIVYSFILQNSSYFHSRHGPWELYYGYFSDLKWRYSYDRLK